MASKLSELIQNIKRFRPYKHEGLETLLDTRALVPQEHELFLRKESLLLYKIAQRVKNRTPEQALIAMIGMSKRNYCAYCGLTRGVHAASCISGV